MIATLLATISGILITPISSLDATSYTLFVVIVTFVGYCVARLRTSATGRMLIAVRSNERAAASVGIRVALVKLHVFALSPLLAIAYVAGIGRIAGAVIAGLMFAGDGLFVSFLDKTLHVGMYQMILAGIALAFTAIQNPDGVASEVASEKGLAPRFVRLRDRVLPGPRRSQPSPTSAPSRRRPASAGSDPARSQLSTTWLTFPVERHTVTSTRQLRLGPR